MAVIRPPEAPVSAFGGHRAEYEQGQSQAGCNQDADHRSVRQVVVVAKMQRLHSILLRRGIVCNGETLLRVVLQSACPSGIRVKTKTDRPVADAASVRDGAVWKSEFSERVPNSDADAGSVRHEGVCKGRLPVAECLRAARRRDRARVSADELCGASDYAEFASLDTQ